MGWFSKKNSELMRVFYDPTDILSCSVAIKLIDCRFIALLNNIVDVLQHFPTKTTQLGDMSG